jgi:hypothetical protein
MTATVTLAEGALVLTARFALGLTSAEEVSRLLASPTPAPPALGPTCRRLLAETLGQGTALALARQGGWYEAPSGARGPLWERGPLPVLEFTGAAVELLQWLLKANLSERDPLPLRTATPLTVAESVLATVLMDRLRERGWDAALAAQGPVRAAPLVALAHAGELGRAAPLVEVPAFDVAALGFAVEGLRGLLGRSWAAAERAKQAVVEPAALRQLGEAQARVLDAFLAAIDAAGRRGLATFLVDAGVALHRGGEPLPDVGRGLASPSQRPLRERAEARRAAGALARAYGRLEGWDQEHRAVRFFEDGYEEAQALVRDWGRLGPAGFAAFRAAAAALEGLPGT